MVDPEIPPEVEGEVDGGGDVVRRIVQGSLVAATVSRVEFTARPWITVTGTP